MTTSFPRSEVVRASEQYGALLKLEGIVDGTGTQLDGVQWMFATACVESSAGANCTPKFEPAYWVGGIYSGDQRQEELNHMFGKDGAKSYGPWQIMLVNCIGYKPEEFSDIDKCAVAYIGFLNRYLEHETKRGRRPKTLEDLADMYNSGNCKDKNVPTAYIEKVREHYFSEVLG
jgi:hypothetical protein